MQAAGYDVEATRLAFLAELSTAYINARFFQNSLELTRQNLASREETLQLTQQLVDASAATVVDLQLARGLVAETRADIPGLEAQFLIQSHRVATLLGLPASSLVREMSRGAPQPMPQRIYSSGVPADLLRNRPDIRIAERNLAASVARIGVARASLYPSISLIGRITGTTAGNSADEATWAFGPIVNLPIFGREALTARVSQREAQARESLVLWKNAVLIGVEEVENALVSVSRARRTVAAERNALETLEESLRLAQDAYSRGERSVLDVLDAERRVGAARIRLAQAQRQSALDFVALNVAIGSGRGLGPAAQGQDRGESAGGS
jgi:multidrug efflux system outer membrane protein